ncbi:MAG TPA: hypothetical protein VFD58_33965 [Blastocatellia bacterium]|nr:hypothetical protein [Blastocatellia bacterium]
MQRKKILSMTLVELERLTTRQLLARLRCLQQCEESIELSDRGDGRTLPDTIEFKNTPEWSAAYQQLKDVLARGEHILKGGELIKLRQQKAHRAKISERRSGRKKLKG